MLALQAGTRPSPYHLKVKRERPSDEEDMDEMIEEDDIIEDEDDEADSTTHGDYEDEENLADLPLNLVATTLAEPQ